ncbi:MAG: hypothetical protein KDH15_04475 [Rhodocyclaceae bacterium]|nr:hypothetical protein [Rhodocyclaceae bacterium]
MSFLDSSSDTAGEREMQKIAGMALRFVYPGLKFTDDQIQPKTAVIALYLARALDGTSRATYGAFKFYEDVTTGLLKGQLKWSDLPKTAFDAAKAAMEDDTPKRNAIAAAFVRQAAPQRLMQRHLEDPENFPPPELQLTPGTPLFAIIFERKGVFEAVFSRGE